MRSRALCFAVVFVVTCGSGGSASQKLRTPAEAADYGRYSQHVEIAEFLQALDAASKELVVQVAGRTLEAKDFAPADIYLCILSKEGISRPAALNRKRPTVLIFASQHGNEQSGKEAALALVRDLAAGDLKPMLRKLNVLVIPQANPYGNFANRRQNEQNLDLNRDHVKLESPQTRAIHRVFLDWMPEVTLDVHEKGDDYYRVSTGCVSNLNIHVSLQEFSRRTLFPSIARAVEQDGYTWHEYLVTDTVGSGMSAGAPPRSPGERPRETLLRYSTPDLNDGRNSLGIYETLSFIQEGSSRHDIATLAARTKWQYSGIRALLRNVADHASRALTLVRSRRRDLTARTRPGAPPDLIHLRMEYVRDPKEPDLVLKRFSRAPGTAQDEPEVVTETVKNWYPLVESRRTARRAAGYLVPGGLTEVIKTLQDHGLRMSALAADAEVEVEAETLTEIVPGREDFLAPERIEVEQRRTLVAAKKGDYYVSGRQPAANLIPCLLEPQSEYGLIRYRAYKLLLQKGEVFPILRVATEVKSGSSSGP